jgi:hypothetical protein
MRGHAVACLSLYKKEGGVAAMVAFLAAYERDARHACVGGRSRIAAVCLNRRSRSMAQLRSVCVINARNGRSSSFFFSVCVS